MNKYQPIATTQLPDPYDERESVWFSMEDLKKLQELPPGTVLYVKKEIK